VFVIAFYWSHLTARRTLTSGPEVGQFFNPRASEGAFDPPEDVGYPARRRVVVSGEANQLEQLIQSLKQQRDELALKIHLGKAEAKAEWGKVEDKLSQLTAEYEPVKEVASETAENVISALELAASEVKAGLDRVSKLL
jgi:hypothetical protein